jgi:NADPH:quinone reductase-like Zn-dependent oxidoreductase
VLEFGEVPDPTPGDDEVLVRVHASSVNPGDWFGVVGQPYVLRLVFGLGKPRRATPGRDVAGTVEAVGAKVTRFRVGDRVYGELPGGGYAEKVVAAADALALVPSTLDIVEAAAVPLAGGTALQGLRDAGGVRAGQRVLVNGASGGVGTFAVQIARSLGAHVTAVCHTRNVELVRSLGAHDVIDYTTDDFTMPRTGRAPYDVIFDLISNHTLADFRRVLSPGGLYLASAGRIGGKTLGPIPFLMRIWLVALRPGRSRAKAFAARPRAADLVALGRLIEAGDVRPVIDRRYGLAQTADALAYQGDGHAQGKTIVMV